VNATIPLPIVPFLRRLPPDHVSTHVYDLICFIPAIQRPKLRNILYTKDGDDIVRPRRGDGKQDGECPHRGKLVADQCAGTLILLVTDSREPANLERVECPLLAYSSKRSRSISYPDHLPQIPFLTGHHQLITGGNRPLIHKPGLLFVKLNKMNGGIRGR
jgi:hypothetical protein